MSKEDLDMEEKKMPTELSEMELESVDGGAAVHNGHRITTALTSAKNCPYYDPGSNFYNLKLLAFKNTCGACTKLMKDDSWHVCSVRND